MATPHAYGENADNYPAVTKPPGQPEEGTVTTAAAGACAFSRAELQNLLKESDYGEKAGAYKAYFRPDPEDDGGHLCRSCGLNIGMHGTGAIQAAATPADGTAAENAALANMKQPTVRLNDIQKQRMVHKGVCFNSQFGHTMERPLHWQGGAWYARFLEFDGYDAGSKGAVRWRCTLPHPTAADADERGDGGAAECGAKFVTHGFGFDTDERPVPGSIASFAVIRDDADSIAKHFGEVHHLEHAPPAAGWTTSLCGCCAHPSALASCMFCYVCPPALCATAKYAGDGFCQALDRVAPYDVEDENPSQHATNGYMPIDEVHCHLGMIFNGYAIIGAYHGSFFAVMVVLGSIFTMCGFPCNSDKLPPLLCIPCYKRRRRIVKAVGSDEGPCATRCISLFCWPCSEVQQWRELMHSGVWPGLMCCTASAEDRAAMAPSAVRARYMSLDGSYGVRAKAGAPAEARRLAASVLERAGPLASIAME